MPAAADLWTAFRPRLLRIAAGFRIPRHEAEDLVQDAFLALVRHGATVEHPEAWLVQTTWRLCCTWYRKRKARSWLHFVDRNVLEASSPAIPPSQDQAGLRLDLQALGARLPWRYQMILVLRFGLGMTIEEAAARLGYKASSIGKLSERIFARRPFSWPRPAPSKARLFCLSPKPSRPPGGGTKPAPWHGPWPRNTRRSFPEYGSSPARSSRPW